MSLRNNGKTKIYKLKNGITCLLNNNSCNNTITINIYFKVGSRDEKPDEEGITHFIEHLFFKGTQKRPTSEHITQEIDEIGGYINAQTGYDSTNYYIKINKNSLEKALDILSDMLYNSLFRPKDIKNEKPVVGNELIMRLSNANVLVGEMLNSLIYKDTNMEHSIGGNMKIINKLNKTKLLNYISKHYTSNNTIISISGNLLNHNNINNLISKYFDKHFDYDVKSSEYIRHQYKNFSKIQDNIRFKNHVFPKITNVTIAIGFPAYHYNHKDSYVLEVIHGFLGANMSSRLFKKVRAENGLVYNIKTDLDFSNDLGNFEINYSTNPNINHINKTLHLIFDELNILKNVKVNSNELKKSKGYLIGNRIISQDNTDYISNSNAIEYAYLNKILSTKYYNDKINNVTSHDIQRVSNIIFKNNKLNIAIISPFTVTLDMLHIILS